MKTIIVTMLVFLAALPIIPTTGWGKEEIMQQYDFDKAVVGAPKTDAVDTAVGSDYSRLIEYRASQSKYILYECILLSIVAIAH